MMNRAVTNPQMPKFPKAPQRRSSYVHVRLPLPVTPPSPFFRPVAGVSFALRHSNDQILASDANLRNAE